ncbi:hypothetical protein LTS14_002167 [Recurvomyces mirabilis]|uniref:uncharacterized protein n=1 Tax=Recurvomyces mirabilis TaxID=574656 RepID=UPI002DE0548D|nr:hypothetical protein LTS14_002167 [Recurvomyces mirabilis]
MVWTEIRAQNVHMITKISWAPSRNISRIPPRLRDRADISIVTTVLTQLRYMCMQVTMDMVRKFEQFESGENFYSRVKGVMIVYTPTIKILNVGLYPPKRTENPAAHCVRPRVLAFDACRVNAFGADLVPGHGCGRSWDQVQDQAQEEGTGPIRGVERIFAYVQIHNSFGFKITAMTMGAFADDTVRRTFSSNRGTAAMMHYIGVTSPAAISYMDVPFEFANEKRIGAVTRALIDHTAEGLFDFFSTMARSLFNDTSMGTTPNTITNKTQQLIITENMISKLNDILASTSWDDDEIAEVLNSYEDPRPDMIKEMEQAVAVAATLPRLQA